MNKTNGMRGTVIPCEQVMGNIQIGVALIIECTIKLV